MDGKSEAQKFFDSLPSGENEEKFNFFEEKQETPVKEEPVTPSTLPEKEETKEGKDFKMQPNRRERRSAQMRFYEEQLAAERAARERLETMILERQGETKSSSVDPRIQRLLFEVKTPEEGTRLFNEIINEIREEVAKPYREFEEARKAEQALESEFDQAIEHGLEDVEETFGVDLTSRSAQKLRSDFLDFVEELSPEDSFVNFEKAWQLFSQNNAAKPSQAEIDRKKQIASRSVQRSSPARPAPEKLQPMTFDKVDNIFSRWRSN